jgi:hypothetical protein
MEDLPIALQARQVSTAGPFFSLSRLQELTIMRAIIFLASLLPAISFADGQNVDRDFRHGHGNGFKGNERSDRPGDFRHGPLSFGGNGCPAGTMRVVFAPDNLTFTILFDKFTADTTSSDGGQRGAMSCDAILPVTLPANQQMEITRVDYRGFVNVPQGARGALAAMFNFQGQDNHGRGGNGNHDRINLRYIFTGPISENYEISTGDMTGGRGTPLSEASPCGGDAQLRVRNVVRVISPHEQQAQLTIDSIDGSANAIYYVNWKACKR